MILRIHRHKDLHDCNLEVRNLESRVVHNDLLMVYQISRFGSQLVEVLISTAFGFYFRNMLEKKQNFYNNKKAQKHQRTDISWDMQFTESDWLLLVIYPRSEAQSISRPSFVEPQVLDVLNLESDGPELMPSKGNSRLQFVLLQSNKKKSSIVVQLPLINKNVFAAAFSLSSRQSSEEVKPGKKSQVWSQCFFTFFFFNFHIPDNFVHFMFRVLWFIGLYVISLVLSRINLSISNTNTKEEGMKCKMKVALGK